MKAKHVCAALLGLAAMVTFSAHAAPLYKDCVVTRVFYDQNRLRLSCTDGASYYGLPACGTAANNSETLRIWVSLGQAALLSGKPLSISHEASTSPSCIYSLELVR